MDFPQKLQELRKNKNMTQEQLAAALYVSRTAVSKWESGRGYPGIDSLKALAAFFSVTVDELLSGNELLTLVEQDNKHQQHRFRDVVFGLLDISTAMLFFLPFFAYQNEGAVCEVSLLALVTASPWLKIACVVLVSLMVLSGLLLLALQSCHAVFWMRIKGKWSLIVNAMAVGLFIFARQPYAAILLFVFLAIKTVTQIKSS